MVCLLIFLGVDDCLIVWLGLVCFFVGALSTLLVGLIRLKHMAPDS